MNKTLPLVAVAALAFAVLSTDTAQAQQFGLGGWLGNGNQPVHGATLGPTIPRFVDFGTVFGNAHLGNAQSGSLIGLPKRDSALDLNSIAINEYGTLGDNRPMLLTAPSFQRKYVRNLQGMQTA